MTTNKKSNPKDKKKTTTTIISTVFDNGKMLELVYAPRLESTALAYWDGKEATVCSQHTTQDTDYVPLAASNNLIRHQVIRFPSYVEPFESLEVLIKDVQSFIHRYVDIEPDFEVVATYYALLSWIYERFNELPYLRLIGDYGTGKTRFLLTVGSLCYKPIVASGASTTSPIFHSLDEFKGTLVLDEADFRFSDAKAEMVKILNNGNVKGFPVLRSEGTPKGGYNPRAFEVFGPKIVATRGHYSDPALESRFISERAKAGQIRADILINLPDVFEKEADSLRNQLLMFRFKHFRSLETELKESLPIEQLRIAQVFRPLLALAQSDEHRHAIYRYAQKAESFLQSFRSHSYEEQVLLCIAELQKRDEVLSVKNITARYQVRYGYQHIKPITPKWIGSIIRSKLHLNTLKRQGLYIIPETEDSKLKALFERYRIEPAA